MDSKILAINESHLGNSVNQALHHAHRDEFSLLLSLLSSDVSDMAQFQSESRQSPSADKIANQLSVPQAAPLVTNLAKEPDPRLNSHYFLTSSPTDFQLAQALQSEAMVFRGSVENSMKEVLENCDLHSRIHHHASVNIASEDEVEFNPPRVDIAAELAKQRHFSQAKF